MATASSSVTSARSATTSCVTSVAQVAVMYLLALKVAQERGALAGEELAQLVAEVRELPHKLAELLESINGTIDRIAGQWSGANFFLYLGRHVGLPVALEGA